MQNFSVIKLRLFTSNPICSLGYLKNIVEFTLAEQL